MDDSVAHSVVTPTAPDQPLPRPLPAFAFVILFIGWCVLTGAKTTTSTVVGLALGVLAGALVVVDALRGLRRGGDDR